MLPEYEKLTMVMDLNIFPNHGSGHGCLTLFTVGQKSVLLMWCSPRLRLPPKIQCGLLRLVCKLTSQQHLSRMAGLARANIWVGKGSKLLLC